MDSHLPHQFPSGAFSPEETPITVSNTLDPSSPHPTSLVTSGDFPFIAQKQKTPEAKVERLWAGETAGRAGPWPSSPLSPLLFPIGEGQDLGSRDGGMDTGGAFTAKGQWSCQGSLEGGSPRPGAKRCEGAEFPSQGPKASRVGQAPCLATEERRLWAAGCWFIYCRVSRASQPPRGMG